MNGEASELFLEYTALSSWRIYVCWNTHPKLNTSPPENDILESNFPFGMVTFQGFQGPCLNLGECIFDEIMNMLRYLPQG